MRILTSRCARLDSGLFYPLDQQLAAMRVLIGAKGGSVPFCSRRNRSAAIKRPGIIFGDEPFSVLVDPKQGRFPSKRDQRHFDRLAVFANDVQHNRCRDAGPSRRGCPFRGPARPRGCFNCCRFLDKSLPQCSTKGRLSTVDQFFKNNCNPPAFLDVLYSNVRRTAQFANCSQSALFAAVVSAYGFSRLDRARLAEMSGIFPSVVWGASLRQASYPPSAPRCLSQSPR